MYFSTIREVGTTQVILPKPSQVRPIKPQPQQPGNGVQTQQQTVQQNGSTNTVNALRQAQKPLNIRK